VNAAEQAAYAYCSALFADLDGCLDGHELTILALPDRRVRWLSDHDPAVIAAAIVEVDSTPGVDAVYLSMGFARPGTPHHTPEGGTRRAGVADVDAILGVWVDIDVAGPGHVGGKRLPETREQALAIARSAGLEPTLIVDSGGGLHAYYLFAEPWVLDTPAAHAAAVTLVRNFQLTLGVHAHRLGRWVIDATHDLARVLRVPGSTNRKVEGAHRRVEVIEHHPDARYNPSDIEAALVEPEILDQLAAIGPVDLAAAGLSAGDLARIWRMTASRAYAERDYLPEWLDLALHEKIYHQSDPLLKVWNGGHPSGDDSATDLSLARRVADLALANPGGLDERDAAEIIMCWRRRNGRKIEKVDPHTRTDYVLRTIARAFTSARNQRRLIVELGRQGRDATAAQQATATHSLSPGEHSDDPIDRVVAARSGARDLGGATAAELGAASLHVLPDSGPDPPPDNPAADPTPDPPPTPIREHTAPILTPRVPRPPSGALLNPFGERAAFLTVELEELGTMLVGPKLAEVFHIWALQRRGRGATQERRLVVKVDRNIWPHRAPDAYVPGRPLTSGWWPAATFNKLAGWLRVLTQDLLVITEPPSAEAFQNRFGTSLIALWEPDTGSGSLVAVTQTAVITMLIDFPPLPDWAQAVEQGMPAIVQDQPRWSLDTPFTVLVRWSEFARHVRTHFALNPNPPTLAEMAELAGAELARTDVQDGQWRTLRRAYLDDDTWASIFHGAAVAEAQREERHGMHVIDPHDAHRRSR